MGVSVRLHVVLALERFAANITLVRLSIAVRFNVFVEIFGLVELGAAEVAAIPLQQLLVVLFVELQVKLALEHVSTHGARMVLGSLTQPAVYVPLHILLFDKPFFALWTLKHFPECKRYVRDSMPLSLVYSWPWLYVWAQ